MANNPDPTDYYLHIRIIDETHIQAITFKKTNPGANISGYHPVLIISKEFINGAWVETSVQHLPSPPQSSN